MLADKADITINNIQSFNEKLLPLISNHLKVVEDVSKEANDIAQKIQNKPDNSEEIKEKMKLSLIHIFIKGISTYDKWDKNNY